MTFLFPITEKELVKVVIAMRSVSVANARVQNAVMNIHRYVQQEVFLTPMNVVSRGRHV